MTGRTVSDIILPRLNNSYLSSKAGEQLYLTEAKEDVDFKSTGGENEKDI